MDILVGLGTILLKTVLATILAAADLMKLAEPKRSIHAMKQYGLNKPAALFVGLTLPIIEVALAILLLVSTTSTFAFGASTALFGGFLAATVFNLLRENRVPCGCFGSFSKKPIDWITAVRTGMFFLASGLATVTALHVSISNDAGGFLVITVVGGVILAIIGTGLTIWPIVTTSEDLATPVTGAIRSQGSLSRRDVLRILGGLAAALMASFIPFTKAQASCCHCEKYDHFEPGCCNTHMWGRTHHYFERCCNSCSGAVGYWHKYTEDTCDSGCCCDMGESCSWCDRMHGCGGNFCYPNECCAL